VCCFPDMVSRVKELTGGKGAFAAIDAVGGILTKVNISFPFHLGFFSTWFSVQNLPSNSLRCTRTSRNTSPGSF
jgi:hypothetical protein